MSRPAEREPRPPSERVRERGELPVPGDSRPVPGDLQEPVQRKEPGDWQLAAVQPVPGYTAERLTVRSEARKEQPLAPRPVVAEEPTL